MTKTEQSEALRALLERCGIRVIQLKILGCYIHLDTFKKYAPLACEAFARMGARVNHLPGDAKGRHLDGSKAYRLVAVLA